jgi:hypothetical protein
MLVSYQRGHISARAIHRKRFPRTCIGKGGFVDVKECVANSEVWENHEVNLEVPPESVTLAQDMKKKLLLPTHLPNKLPFLGRIDGLVDLLWRVE